MSCAARAVPAGALAGWRTPATTGGERLGFPAHTRCRSARLSGDSTRVTTSFLVHRRGVATASLDAGTGGGATRECSQRSLWSHETTLSSRDVAARAVTDPQGVRGAEDEPSNGGDEDASEDDGRRDDSRRPGRRATSASPQRRRSASSDAEYRARAVMYGRERERRNAPDRGTSETWSTARPRKTHLPTTFRDTANVFAIRRDSPPRRAFPAATVGARELATATTVTKAFRLRAEEFVETRTKHGPLKTRRLARSSAASRARWREGTWKSASRRSRRVTRRKSGGTFIDASPARSRRTTKASSPSARSPGRHARTWRAGTL